MFCFVLTLFCRYSGVFEAVKIRKSGFPFRQKHAAFMERYGCTIGKENMLRGSAADCKNLAAQIKLPTENVKEESILLCANTNLFYLVGVLHLFSLCLSCNLLIILRKINQIKSR